MAPHSVVVTGANRGIGLGLVRRFLENQAVKQVIATSRNVENATALQEIKDSRLHLLSLDVDCDKSIDNFVKEVGNIVGDNGVNLLVNNAGIHLHYECNQEADRTTLRQQFETNATSVIVLTQKFIPLLKKAAAKSPEAPLSIDRAAVVVISSGLGSITDNTTGSGPMKMMAYRVSKSAVNAFVRCFAIDMKKDGILATAFCPGWVQTDMGGPRAMLTVDQSTTNLVESFGKLNESNSGYFYKNDLTAFEF